MRSIKTAIGRVRNKPPDFFWLQDERDYTRVATAEQIKKPQPFPVGVWDWWSRRESNPRPQALYRQFYILSPVFLCFKLDHARRTGWVSPSRLGFSTHPSDPDEHDFM